MRWQSIIPILALTLLPATGFAQTASRLTGAAALNPENGLNQTDPLGSGIPAPPVFVLPPRSSNASSAAGKSSATVGTAGPTGAVGPTDVTASTSAPVTKSTATGGTTTANSSAAFPILARPTTHVGLTIGALATAGAAAPVNVLAAIANAQANPTIGTRATNN